MKEKVIKPFKIFSFSNYSELWLYKGLFYTLIWRDIKVRYKQTIFGVAWAVFQPLISMVIFTIFFGNLAKVPSGDLPYSLFVLIGLVFWTFFSNSLSYASDSLHSNETIIKRIYFPRMILPLASVAKSFVDFIIAIIMVFIFGLALGYYPHFQGLFIFPWAILITIITASGLGFLLSSINVKYRDVKYILPFFIQMLLFFNPIIYPLSIVSQRNRIIMALNPLTSVVESVRLVFVGDTIFTGSLILISTISALLIFIIGTIYFNKTEKFIADII